MKIVAIKDGSDWVAYDEETFVDLQESLAEYGSTEENAIANFKKLHEETFGVEDDTTELQSLVDLFNEFSDSNISWMETGSNYYGLIIDDSAMCEGDLNDVVERMKQINRENGYDRLK